MSTNKDVVVVVVVVVVTMNVTHFRKTVFTAMRIFLFGLLLHESDCSTTCKISFLTLIRISLNKNWLEVNSLINV